MHSLRRSVRALTAVPLRWAMAGAHRRPRTVRVRLTAIYGALVLLCGAAVLTITYVLVAHSTGVLTFHTRDGKVGAVSSDASGATTGIESMQTSKAGPTSFDPAHLADEGHRMRALAERQHNAMLHQLMLDSGIALGVTAVLAAALGWIIAGRVLRPLRTITATVREISATNLHRRLDLGGPQDELTELGATFNGLLARLEAAFHAQRQFVANASHELRTPLARQRAIGQVAITDPDASVESLRTAHQRILVAGAEQERTILALLALARGQAGPVRSERVDLAQLARDVVSARATEADLRGLRIDAALDAAPITGDSRLLESLVANLIDNALRHNVAGGRVTVATSTAGPTARLRVRNTGPIVPPDEVARLFQPFHRLGPDRAARGDGLGVGLSIVAAVCDAHGAQLDVRAPAAGGLAITVAFAAAIEVDPTGVELDPTGDCGRPASRAVARL